MILVVCNKDVDWTLLKGDLIAWHDDKEYLGRQVSVVNGVTQGAYLDKDEYLAKAPFIILNLPLVTEHDALIIAREMIIFGEDSSVRKWKVDFSALEQRSESYYDDLIQSDTKDKFLPIESGQVRRDTLTAYNEITRNDITIDDIKVLR